MADAFIIRHDNMIGRVFATAFLASPDFDKLTIDGIARQLGVGNSKSTRPQLVDLITPIFDGPGAVSAARIVIEKLVSRRREWAAVKVGEVKHFPRLSSPEELVLASGIEKWYGPISCYSDKMEASWYVRPVYIDHWEVEEADQTRLRKVRIRWLCFARAMPDSLSLHWRGFTYVEEQRDVTPETDSSRSVQFPYWNYIPGLSSEIEDLTQARVQDLDLHDLILYKIWDEYRERVPYDWKDTRIRAESSGVALNAHSAGIEDINPTGIMHLATTVRKAMQEELREKYKTPLPDPDHLDLIILRTLIREYGALSYGFRLKNQNSVLFNAHSYFGHRPMFNSADKLAHLRFYVTKRHNLEQLEFLLAKWKGSDYHEESEYRTLPML